MNRYMQTALAATIFTLASYSYAEVAAPTSPAVSVAPAERAKIESVVHDYLVRKPEVLIEAMQALQARQYQQAEKSVQQTQQTAGSFASKLFHESNDPVAGNPNGAVSIVEFFDYQCPHCIDMAPVISSIIKSNPNVRIVFKEFPIRGPISEFAARAALAANLQGKYYDFSHALLTSSTEPLTQDAVFSVAKNTGLNVDQLKKDMNGSVIDAQIKANIKLAQDLKLFGTPAFFIGKTEANDSAGINYVPGQMDQKQLQAAIDKLK